MRPQARSRDSGHMHGTATNGSCGLVLNNGVVIPKVGFGTAGIPRGLVANCVGVALEAGYRLIDTAPYYRNEAEVGDAVGAAAIPREDVFLTSKGLGRARLRRNPSQPRAEPGATWSGVSRSVLDPLATRAPGGARRRLAGVRAAVRRAAHPRDRGLQLLGVATQRAL